MTEISLSDFDACQPARLAEPAERAGAATCRFGNLPAG
jgi:hypothetical protein